MALSYQKWFTFLNVMIPQRWSWAIREVSQNDGTSWKQLLDLHTEVFAQGRNSPFFNKVLELMREVKNP